MMRVAIEVLSGQDSGRAADIEGEAIRIGRALDNEIALADEQISSSHARSIRIVVSASDAGSR